VKNHGHQPHLQICQHNVLMLLKLVNSVVERLLLLQVAVLDLFVTIIKDVNMKQHVVLKIKEPNLVMTLRPLLLNVVTVLLATLAGKGVRPMIQRHAAMQVQQQMNAVLNGLKN